MKGSGINVLRKAQFFLSDKVSTHFLSNEAMNDASNVQKTSTNAFHVTPLSSCSCSNRWNRTRWSNMNSTANLDHNLIFWIFTQWYACTLILICKVIIQYQHILLAKQSFYDTLDMENERKTSKQTQWKKDKIIWIHTLPKYSCLCGVDDDNKVIMSGQASYNNSCLRCCSNCLVNVCMTPKDKDMQCNMNVVSKNHQKYLLLWWIL